MVGDASSDLLFSSPNNVGALFLTKQVMEKMDGW